MKVMISIVAAVVLLGVIGTVTVMAQSPETTPTPTTTAPTTPAKFNINARVAEILGVTEAQLNDAIKQAKIALSTPATPATPATPTRPTKPVRPAPIKPTDLYAKVAQILGNNITADNIESAFQQAQNEMRNQNIKNALDNAVKNGKISSDEENQIEQWWQNRPAAVDKLGIPPGPGVMGPGQPGLGKMGPSQQFWQNFQRKAKNLQNHLNDFENRLKNLENKVNQSGSTTQ
jgi:hypothetical protein